jgi:hypothetical protein
VRTLLSIALFLATSLSMTACIDFPARPILSTTPDMGTVDSGTPDQTVIDQDDVRVDARDAAADLSTADGVGSACDPECARPELCLEDVGVCAKCMVDNDCDEGDTLLCRRDEFDPGNNQCVACLSNENCTDPANSRCDESSRDCVGCAEDGDCSHLSGTPHCFDADSSGAGSCYQCTPETEIMDCGLNSCDVSTLHCTGTKRGQTQTCEVCHASSECVDDHRCVPMKFMTDFRIGEDGRSAMGFCLKEFGQCPDPYAAGKITRHDLETNEEKEFCGINEALTTCEAVSGYGLPCSANTECGAANLEDALCTTINGSATQKCSYPCANVVECDNTSCSARTNQPLNYCGAE